MTISGFFSSELKSVGEAAEPARAVVFVQGLHKWHGMFESLRGVDLEVTRGEVVVILGPDGAGKTTLMEILGGVRTPSSGVVKVSARTRAAPVRRGTREPAQSSRCGARTAGGESVTCSSTAPRATHRSGPPAVRSRVPWVMCSNSSA